MREEFLETGLNGEKLKAIISDVANGLYTERHIYRIVAEYKKELILRHSREVERQLDAVEFHDVYDADSDGNPVLMSDEVLLEVPNYRTHGEITEEGKVKSVNGTINCTAKRFDQTFLKFEPATSTCETNREYAPRYIHKGAWKMA